MNRASPRTVRLGYSLKAVWAIVPKPMLLRWRILIESGDLLQLLAGLLLDLLLDPGDQLLGLLVVAVDELPAGALGHVAADQQDGQAEDGAEPEGQPPAEVGREPVGVEQEQGKGGPEHGAEPERAVDDQVDPAPQPGRDQLVDGRVDGRVLAADPGPGEEPAHVEEQRGPGERRGHGGQQVQDQDDHEQLLAAEAVGQVAED
jgi:hypothetical protein